MLPVRKRKGTTLVETSVALAVAGVVLAVAIAAVSGIRDTAMARTAVMGMRSTLRAAVDHRLQHGSWPASIDDLALPERGRSTPWGQPFVMENPTERSISIRASLPHGVLFQGLDAPNVVVEADGTVRMAATLDGGEDQELAFEKKNVFLE